MTSHTCPIDGTALVCPTCRARAWGSGKSRKKAIAARRNGKKGGRPKKEKETAS